MSNDYYLFSGMYLFILVVDTFCTDRVRLRSYMAIGWGKYYQGCLPLIQKHHSNSN